MCTTGGVHALTCCTHFSVAQFVCAHPHIFMLVHIHAWLKCHEKGVCRISVFVLYLAFSLLMSHPSFAVSVRRLSLCRLSRPHVLAVLTCLKSAGHAHLRTRTRSSAIWPSPPSTQKKALRQYWFSPDCGNAGGEKQWSVTAISEMCKTCEQRLNTL